jgi:hypothetical protein
LQYSQAWVQQAAVPQVQLLAVVALVQALQLAWLLLLLLLALGLVLLLLLLLWLARRLTLLLLLLSWLALGLALLLMTAPRGLLVLAVGQVQLLQASLLLSWLLHCWHLPSKHSWIHPHSPTAASCRHTLPLVLRASLHMTVQRPRLPLLNQLLRLLCCHLPG